jgi:hypothetical protein
MPQVQRNGLNFEQIRTCSNVDKFLSKETLWLSANNTQRQHLGGLNPTVQHERKKEPQSSVRKKT